MTPNRTELEDALGRSLGDGVPDGSAATEVLDGLGLDALVMTLDRHGALLVRPGEDALHVPTAARSVYDVTGAGDMVLAALAVAIGNGLARRRRSSSPMPQPDLRWRSSARSRSRWPACDAKSCSQTPPDNSVRTLEELAVELAVHREAGRRIALTNGCFDVVHAGHVAYLREAANLGDILVVGVNVDAEVAYRRGRIDRCIRCSSVWRSR